MASLRAQVPDGKTFRSLPQSTGGDAQASRPGLQRRQCGCTLGSSPLLLLANAGVEPLFRPRAGLAFILPWMGTTPYQLDSLCTFWDEHDPRQNRNKIKILLVS